MNRKHVPLILESLLKKRRIALFQFNLYCSDFNLHIGIAFIFMQVIDASYYKSEADGNRIRHLPVQAARGVIYDRNGIVLAGSKSSYSITIPVDRQGIQIKDEELKKYLI